MRFNSLFPSKWLKSDDLEQPCVLRIKDVTIEQVGGEGGDRKPVVHFVGYDKALILNKTNGDAIASLVGSDDTDDWIGARIELYKAQTRVNGALVPCVRIREPRGTSRAAVDGFDESAEA